MKKLQLSILVAVFFSTAAFCQLNKGTWIVGGNAGFNSSNFKLNSIAETKTSNFQLTATAGYFVVKNFPLGVRSTWQFQRQKYHDATGATGEGNSNYLSIGPFARYYFLKKTDRMVNILIEANYSFGSARPDISANTYHFNRYSILAGPVIYFNSSVGLEFTIGYFNDKPSDGRNPTTGFQTNIGFQIHLEKNKPDY